MPTSPSEHLFLIKIFFKHELMPLPYPTPLPLLSPSPEPERIGTVWLLGRHFFAARPCPGAGTYPAQMTCFQKYFHLANNKCKTTSRYSPPAPSEHPSSGDKNVCFEVHSITVRFLPQKLKKQGGRKATFQNTAHKPPKVQTASTLPNRSSSKGPALS